MAKKDEISNQWKWRRTFSWSEINGCKM